LVRIGFFALAGRKSRSGKLVIAQCQPGIELNGIGPNGNSFIPST